MSDIAKLFRWKKKVSITQGDKVIGTAYVRLIGDNDYAEARNIALKSSKLLRAKLRDPNSEEYQATFIDIDAMSREELIMNILFSEMPSYRDEYLATFPEETPLELSDIAENPDNPTLEEQEIHQTKVDEARKKRINSITEFIEKRSGERRDELKELESIDELRGLHKTAMVNLKCTEEFGVTFREHQVYKGTYEDSKCTKLAFDSFEEFQASSPQLKTQLTTAYVNLEVSGEDLKN